MRHKQSDYLYWAKMQSRARYNLATSGVGAFPLHDLSFDYGHLEIHGDNRYGYAPLQCAIARHTGVEPECVVEAAGTSMANHLAMAAILEPGDQVLMEQPVYGPVLDAARYLEAGIRRFPRRPEDGFAVDPEAVRGALTPRTRLIVLTNLHNPSSVLTPEATLQRIGELAAEAGALVLVDEVYLDAVYDHTPSSAFRLGPQFVVTSSLTKIYGVSGLRCGWILAQPELAWKMRRLNDLYGSLPAHPAELLCVAAFANLNRLRDRARRVVEADRALLAAFLDRHPELQATRTEFGTTCFARLPGGDADAFLARLRAEHDTSAVPGRFFEMSDYIRIGMGVDTEMFREGLRRLELALGAYTAG
ncbi:MAG TPA: pyridoxal phosphate-dependent aminotransferase [Bryobacteraceae bacterium]|nr:pyridoxal phosphate-dependent aminotransferase [Bryobacteraceae bacterium]